MTEDPYADFADRYDLFQSAETDEARRRRWAFFQRLFREHGLLRLLDCACGTGGDLLAFHRLGIDVVGSDISPAMLAVAKRRLEVAGVKIPLVQSDFCNLERTVRCGCLSIDGISTRSR